MSTVMVEVFYCVVLCVTLQALVFGERFNVTSGAQDYFKAAQHHFLHSIELKELEIANAEAIYAGRLDVIHLGQHQMLHEIHQINQNLMPMQSLSLVRKHCIQKYAPQLVTRTAARSQLEVCHVIASHGIDLLTSKAKAQVNSARSYALGPFVENVNACSSKHFKNDTALESCYVENVESASKTITIHLRSAQEYLERNSFDSSVISGNAMRCTYRVTSDILKSLGATLRDINDCQKNFIPDKDHLGVNHHKEALDMEKDINHQSMQKVDNEENEIRRDRRSFDWLK